MQHLPTWVLWGQSLTALLGIAAHAALALPFITALTLLVGQRERTRLCVCGSYRLTQLALCLAFFWPVTLLLDLGLQLSLPQGILRLPSGFSPWMPVMLPYSTAIAAWLGGVACLFWQMATSRPTYRLCLQEVDIPRDSSAVRVWPSWVATLCFFAAHTLPSCPFAGLPEGMTMGRAALAISSASLHTFFMYFTPAGALALLVFSHRPHGDRAFPAEDRQAAARWCTLWAMVGYFPYCLDNWGMFIGFTLRQDTLPSLILQRLPALAAVTAAFGCWTLLFFCRAPRRLWWLNTLAVFLLILGTILPFVVKFP